MPNWLLLHLWDHPHDAMSFKMKIAVKKRIYGARTKVWTFLQTAARGISGRADVEAQEISSLPDEGSSEFLGNRTTSPAFMYAKTPKRLIERLVASEMDPPYGWGLYFEEGFRMPLAIQYSLSALLTGLIGGLMIYCISRVKHEGFGVFSTWGGTISAASLIFAIITKIIGK